MKLFKKKEEKDKKVYTLDTIQEQSEHANTTVFCLESITAQDLKKVAQNPRNYIEINIIKKIRVVDNFYIPSNLKKFTYKEVKYDIVEGSIYLLSTKSGYLMPTSFYWEGDFEHKPIDFRQTNIGISGKEFSLLYDEELFKGLFPIDETKYNLFIVILQIFSLGGYWIGIYLLFGMG